MSDGVKGEEHLRRKEGTVSTNSWWDLKENEGSLAKGKKKRFEEKVAKPSGNRKKRFRNLNG